jgi:hypothetical protein
VIIGVRLQQIIQNKRVSSLSKEALGNAGPITQDIDGRPVFHFCLRIFLLLFFVGEETVLFPAEEEKKELLEKE